MTRSRLFGVLVLLCSCAQQQEPNQFADDTLIAIADLQDRRETQKLIPFLSHTNANYRKTSALALASVQDSSAQHELGRVLLEDADTTVQEAAAFALGQTGTVAAYTYLIEARNKRRFSALDEALGKTIPAGTPVPEDLSSWGLYRMALRSVVDSTHVPLAERQLRLSENESTRLGAAHFFNRGPSHIDAAEKALLKATVYDPSVFVRMASAAALRKINSAKVRDEIQQHLPDEKDYRVRINLIRSLQPYPLAEAKEAFIRALNDENINVGIAAAEVMRQNGAGEYSFIVSRVRDNKHWRVKASLYEAAMAQRNHKELAEEIVKQIESSDNSYEKAALIAALGYSPMHYTFVRQLLSSEVPVIRTAAISALVSMNLQKDFESGMRKQFLAIYREAIGSADAAVIGIAASALGNASFGYKDLIADPGFLFDAKARLSLPRDNEALQPLETAIAYLEGKASPEEVHNAFNHPIDWAFVQTIPVAQKVLVRTTKGDIVLAMLVEEAPGSVANFLHLATAGYFDGKNFHRVVPNFVIQGGCNRGDGWGSEDYSIRSEFSTRVYGEGSVGMASAGKDTEGTQWFITHSPTPHLDGRYTLFGEVAEGMDVVHQMEVGDRILSVEIR
jgi:cyclophilin family peptidyl-prolyl cis-trans isomerase/HEAT repeat protein